jgi:putative sigma-54 modulation protein
MFESTGLAPASNDLPASHHDGSVAWRCIGLPTHVHIMEGAPVNVLIQGRNMTVSDDLRQIAEDRIERSERIFDGRANVDVEFTEKFNPSRSDGRFKVEITSNVAGHFVRGEADALDARSALDSAADRYERQLRRLKERMIQRTRTRDHKAVDVVIEPTEEQPDPGRAVVRTKQFAMRPMATDEAILQMEMLGHDFFFFFNAESGKYSVVYSRRDGDIGLIEPE